jgi:membrane fusion protein, multidrug efflux system
MRSFSFPILLILVLASGCSSKEPKAAPSEQVPVRLKEIKQSKISIPVHSTGILVSSEEIKLSFKTGGIVSEIPVREGQKVHKGDLLASLNLSEINAHVTQANDGYEKAARDYKRAENLYRDSVVTLEQKQNAATALNVAKSSLEIATFNLAHAKILAPDDGIILRQLVKQDEMVSQGYPVFLFGSSGKHWKVKCGLSDKDVVKVHKGDSASIIFDAWPGVKFQAVVDLLGEMANSYTGTYDAELLLKRTSFRLASGFVAGVNISPSEKKSFFLIPISSIVEADGQHGYIYTVTDSMTARKLRVEIGTIIGSLAAVKEIPSGVTKVVSEGAAYLKDGVRVKVVKQR